MRRKIVLIGAGSAMFTKGLILDIIERRDEQWHIALVDTDARTLEIIKRVCEKMIAQTASDTELSASTDRCDVLPGADYVVSTIASAAGAHGSRTCLSPENTACSSLLAIRSAPAACRARCA